DGIFLSQDKYVGDILKKFGLSDVRSAKTPMDKEHPWGKDGTGKDVELHLYRSMIGSLMYLTASRPDIMFAVCACARHQVTPKECHLHAVKRIFRYLKCHPMLGLWYPKESPFDLVAFSDSDYGGANQDRKSTSGGCQFLGRRLISWQCKKQTIVATSTTEADFMNTKIYIDNNSAICIVKNPVYHSKTKHIEGGNDNVADLLTKAFDVRRVETVDGETKIIAKVNGRQRTVTESSIRRHLKLLVNEGTVQLFESMLVPQGEGLENPTEPHHTPSAQYESTPQEDQTTSPEPIPQATTLPSQSHLDIYTPRRLTRGAIRISQSKAPTPGADETTSPTRDDKHGEAFPTTTSLDAGQDR
ncbi:hypothetical protein Tco_0462875, partial [Tanacetum coccineum]